MKLVLETDNCLRWPNGHCPAVIGKGGLIALDNKREGDGATPCGEFEFRRVLYRADRLDAPQTSLPCRAIDPNDGWCDDPDDPAYNQPVYLPYRASAESLFRDDHLYDLLVVLGHNDQPPQPGFGSAIFFHLARKDGSGTRGCIAIAKEDMQRILQLVTKASVLIIPEPEPCAL